MAPDGAIQLVGVDLAPEQTTTPGSDAFIRVTPLAGKRAGSKQLRQHSSSAGARFRLSRQCFALSGLGHGSDQSLAHRRNLAR